MSRSTSVLDGQTYVSKRLAWPFLIIPALLVAIYGMLSYISLADQSTFFSSMDIPEPSNEFLIWSWGGKNSAMVAVLLAGVITRVRLVVVISLIMLLVGQMGDVNAGAQSGTNVFVTWIAFGLVVAQGALLLWDRSREQASATQATATPVAA
ncbi:MAG: hypothetical protein AAGA93_09490 [Actinomycetota bacterium]